MKHIQVAFSRTLLAQPYIATVLFLLALILLNGGFASKASSQIKTDHQTVFGLDPGSKTSLKVYDVKTGAIRVLYTASGYYEAPYFSRDGKFVYFDGGPNHKLYRVSTSGGQPQLVDVGDVEVHHDEAFSPDGKWYALNIGTQLFVSTVTGADRHPITKPGSVFYLHEWSPDSLSLVGARRSPGDSYDVARISMDGTNEERLTSTLAFNDGPDYSADGKWIYFNSDRAGSFDVWRIPASGAGPGDKLAQQVTNDDQQDWFPHPSPDGKWLVFLSYSPEVGAKIKLPQWLKEHPGETISHFNLAMHPYSQNVTLRMRPLPGNTIDVVTPKVLTHMIGGQGSLNLNSWSPDSKQFVFTSYEP